MPRTPDTSPQTLRVFGALLEEPGAWHHGYALSKQTGLASGTLYPILMRLAEREILETRWEEPTTPGRPPRHAYRLTTDGAVLARQRLAEASADKTKTARVRPALSPRSAS
jgi:DNA-binding PadR family transcriptional regulator